jgi:hypothetical protein
MTGVTSGAGTVYPFGAREFNPGVGVAQSLVFCVVFCSQLKPSKECPDKLKPSKGCLDKLKSSKECSTKTFLGWF